MQALLAALLVVSTAPPATACDEADWAARYEVHFVAPEGQAPRARVELVLRRRPGYGTAPDALELTMASGYPGGYGRFVRNLESFAPEGTRTPAGGLAAVSADLEQGRFQVPVLREGVAGLRYEVVLEHEPEQGIGWDETPHAFSDGVLWTGRALFLTVEASSVEIVLHAPAGQRVSTSLDPLKDGSGHHAASPNDLRETYLLVGGHLERTLDLQGARVLLAIDGAAAAAADSIEQEVRGFFAATRAAIGGPPPARCLVAITVAQGEGGGSVYGRDAHVLANGPPPESSSWRTTLCHELFHLYNPRQIRFDSREMWFSEGFTEYCAHMLLARTRPTEQGQFLRSVGAWLDAYTPEAGKIGLRKAGELGNKNNTLIYQGGALAALCVDVSVRDATGNRSSLDDVLARLWEQCGSGAGEEIPVAELEKLLAKLGGRELGGFLARHVEGAEVLPLVKTLKQAGLRLEQREVRVPEMDAVVHLLQCPGLTVVPAGIRVDRTSLPGLADEDVLLQVAGRPVSDFGDLRVALADGAPGAEVSVELLRAGKRARVELRLAGHGEKLPAQARTLATLEPDPGASKKAKAIRNAIFGL